MQSVKQKMGRSRVIFIVVFAVAVGIIGFAAIFFLFQGSQWRFENGEWKAGFNTPACEDPLAIGPPMDMKRATSKLYPGQVRGDDFKPHGGLAIDNAENTQVDIFAVRDAKLTQIARYKENGAEQYLLDFVDACGIKYRYDHIAKVSPEIAKYTDSLEVKDNDSRTIPVDGPLIKKGTIVAIEVGQLGNVGFDLGVYDLRKQNEASKTEIYRTDERRIADKEQSFYAVCWFDLLPAEDRQIVDRLPSRSSQQEGTNSDYCSVK